MRTYSTPALGLETAANDCKVQMHPRAANSVLKELQYPLGMARYTVAPVEGCIVNLCNREIALARDVSGQDIMNHELESWPILSHPKEVVGRVYSIVSS